MLFGGLLCGYFSDKIGRRPCLIYSLGLNTAAGLASACVPNVQWLIFCRVVGGVGIGGSVPVVFSLGAEIFPSHVRGKLLSLIASFWMVGAIFTSAAAWVMLGDSPSGERIIPHLGWQWFAAVSALPALSALVLAICYVPESPTFLFEKGQFDAAAAVLEYLAGFRVDPHDLVPKQRGGVSVSDFNKKDENNKLLFDASASASSSRHAYLWARYVPHSFLILFQEELLKTTVVLLVIWFTLCYGSYGISTWISELFVDVGIANAYLASFIFALANLPGNVVAYYTIEVYGRRRLLSYGMSLAGVAAIMFALNPKNAVVVVTCASLFNAASVVGWNSLDCLSVESFPTGARGSAMGVLASAGRIGRWILQLATN